ncbi:MAG: ATP-dependent DNA ligase [Actinomycetes bacterium]
MQFVELAATSAAVASTSARRTKIDLLAETLRRLPEHEVAAGAAYLCGELRQRQIGVGWASLREVPAPAETATLSIEDVDAALERIGATSGAGSQTRRREQLHALFAQATVPEQQMLRGLLSGELRQGAQVGLLVDAIARAAGVELGLVRRALLLSGDFKTVARAALFGGAGELAGFGLQVGRPLAPMLAQSAASIADALATTGAPAVVDAKLDGIRIQVHRSGSDIGVFTRSLDDITARVPEVVAAVRALPLELAVLDGEAIGLDTNGRPRPFQETASRAGRRVATEAGLGEHLMPYFFDLLHLDGTDLLDEPGRQRWAALGAAVPAGLLVSRRTVETVPAGEEAFAAALAAGQEGVVIKAPDAPYDVGRRGGAWVKVKPRHTLDLVVLAAEWGHGRRQGWLSNLHLGARDPQNDGFVMLGKTFKGLTDELLRWQTERFLEIAVDRGDWVVTVRPELVVEIAFDGVQTSTRYPGGVALRFARVLRYRPDKTAAEADTIDTIYAIQQGRAGAW